ncbi:IAP-5 [Betabaculovirus altermyunipunctae]|uniref:IAP-5 n=1 Tax=Betabaculovirus altermyunipunctae TaxID=3051996 RepID=A0A1S5YE12_9BBAC|nr:IAP-5 [Betabaculovirus altermyunipunctae]AQQ80389.1 IAP-5 [Betabaculovirus altermyunipunctae]
MKSYQQRLATYAGVWQPTDTRLQPDRLALLGFYYTGMEDKIKCAYCGLTLSNFRCGSNFYDPLLDHKRYSADCQFIYENLQTPAVYVNTGHGGQLVTMESRMRTFERWPVALRHMAFEMCLAGLYYTGVGDEVVCFVCGERFDEWWPNDVPCRRHHERSPHCPYVVTNSFRSDAPPPPTTAAQPPRPAAQPTRTTATAPDLQTIQHEDHWRLPQCVACRAGYVGCVLTPCFHLCVCDKCSASTVECPVCASYVSGAFKINIPVRHLSTF